MLFYYELATVHKDLEMMLAYYKSKYPSLRLLKHRGNFDYRLKLSMIIWFLSTFHLPEYCWCLDAILARVNPYRCNRCTHPDGCLDVYGRFYPTYLGMYCDLPLPIRGLAFSHRFSYWLGLLNIPPAQPRGNKLIK